MTEHLDNRPSDTQQDPSQFGPQQTDIDSYETLLHQLESGSADLGFNARVNAELTSGMIDSGSLGSFVNSDVGNNGLDVRSTLKLAQQRYIAAALGLRVGETEVSATEHAAAVKVNLPSEAALPPLPQRTPDGKFIASNGAEISRVQVDALYAGHFIANNHEEFSKPGAFERLFGRVVEQAETGRIEVQDRVGDHKGAASLVRQVIRVLGYKVGDFVKDAQTGDFIMTVDGIKPGFDSQHTHFKI